MKLRVLTNFLILIYGLSITALALWKLGTKLCMHLKMQFTIMKQTITTYSKIMTSCSMMTTQIVLITYYLLYPSAFFSMSFVR